MKANFERTAIVILILAVFASGVFSPPVRVVGYRVGFVRIVSHSSFYNIFNTLWVVGEVANEGEDMATTFTEITATFYNATGQIVAVEVGYADLDILLTGRKSPFEVLLTETEGSLQVHNYTLTVSWSNYAAGKPIGLEILSNSSNIDETGYMHVTGVIKNIGTMPATFTEVMATFYDESGTVVGADSEYTEPLHLTPNQTGIFDVELIYTQQVMKVASYSLTAESIQYSIIPEFPSTISLLLLMLIISLLITLAKKKRYNPT